MTRETKLLVDMWDILHRECHKVVTEENYDAIKKSIEALEQEPCEDCISRQAVIELCEGWWLGHTKEDDFATEIRALPSVNPKKIGHWVDKFGGVYRCSECRELIELDCEITTPKSIERFRYCPNCGAKMVEPQESEVGND